ncbi:hypothetical protein QW180_31265 [Vibrio sinaloensis]|nr:hypothetical protein [Vibrio sinaloensis]
MASGACLGLCLAAYVSATKYTTLANAVFFLIYTGPVFSTILAAVFLKEKNLQANSGAVNGGFHWLSVYYRHYQPHTRRRLNGIAFFL